MVIEKILTGAERLPRRVAGLRHDRLRLCESGERTFCRSAVGRRALERIYRNFIDDEIDFDDLAYRCRKLIIRVALASELNVLANQLTRIALSKRRTCDFTLNSLRDALTEVVASFPVYRTYVSAVRRFRERCALHPDSAIASAKWRSPAADTSIFDFIADVLLTQHCGRPESRLPECGH